MTSFRILFWEDFFKDFTFFWRLASRGTTWNSFDNKIVKTVTLRFTLTTLFDSS